MKNKPILLILFILGFFLMAAIPVKTFHWEDSLPKVLDLDEVKKVSSLNKMAKAKWYENNRDWYECLQNIETVNSSSASLWIAVTHLTCLRNTYQTSNKLSAQKMVQSFSRIEKVKGELLNSPFKGHKNLLISVFLDLMKKSIEKGRDVFDDFVSRNHDLVDQFDDIQRAEYYKYMGELAWLRQKNELAIGNFLRSYAFNEDSEVYKRLQTLDALKYVDANKYKKGLINDEETAEWNSFYNASERGQTIKVVREGVDFLNKYPGSEKNEDVSRRIAIFFKRLLYRRDKKYISQKKSYIDYMRKAPAEFLYEWADIAYQRGYYDSCLTLAEEAVEKWEGQKSAAEALLLASRSSYYLTQWSDSKKYLQALIDKHSDHEAHFEAHYLMGLLFYRQKQYDNVIALYDRFLLHEGSDRWELQVRYWLWRALQKMNSPRSKDIGESILQEFPLTYYGLLVRMETSGGLQTLIHKEIPKISASYWWTLHNSKRWTRIKTLLENGWLDEAEREIDMLPDPQLAESYVIRAKLWQGILRTRRAMQDYSDAVDKNTDFLTSSLLKISFPKSYESEVLAAQKEFSISDELIWAVMRQESAFERRALSPSQAYGLMQMLKPTMKETARWLRVKNFNFERDHFNTQMNVRFGTHFLSRMIRKYKGVVPLAVASYNVGPGNLDRWLRQRTDMDNWSEYGSDPDQEMWMDELPWGETSFYVKAVMRNFLLYRIIHDQYDKLESPSWSGAQDFYQVPSGS